MAPIKILVSRIRSSFRTRSVVLGFTRILEVVGCSHFGSCWICAWYYDGS